MLDSQSYETLVEKLADEILDDGMEVQASDYYDTATNYDEEAYDDMYDYEKDAAVADYEMEITAGIKDKFKGFGRRRKAADEAEKMRLIDRAKNLGGRALGAVKAHPYRTAGITAGTALTAAGTAYGIHRHNKKKREAMAEKAAAIADYEMEILAADEAEKMRLIDRAKNLGGRALGAVKAHPYRTAGITAGTALTAAGTAYGIHRHNKKKREAMAEKAAAYYDEAQLIKEAAENVYYEADYYNDYDCDLMKMAAEDAYDEADAMEEAALNVADSLYDSYDDGYGYDDDYDYE